MEKICSFHHNVIDLSSVFREYNYKMINFTGEQNTSEMYVYNRPTLMEDTSYLPVYCNTSEAARCLCDREVNHAIDISSLQMEIDELGLAVDWWAEGVCLPVIALVGICGEYNNIIVASPEKIYQIAPGQWKIRSKNRDS